MKNQNRSNQDVYYTVYICATDETHTFRYSCCHLIDKKIEIEKKDKRKKRKEEADEKKEKMMKTVNTRQIGPFSRA